MTTVEAPAAPPKTGVRVALVAALVLLALCVRMGSFIGYQGRDDRSYVSYAQYVIDGHEVSALPAANQWVGRIGFWLPVAGSMKVLGSNQFGYVVFPLLVSVAGVLLTFALASITVGFRAGALAAFLLALLPLDVLYATRPYPDVTLGVLMVAGFWLTLKSRHALRFAPVAGLVLGLAYLNKETAVFAGVPVALALRFWRPHYWRALALIGVAFAAVVVLEMGFWAAAKGDPLYRFTSTGSALDTASPDAAPSGGLLAWIPGPRPADNYRSSNSILDAALMLTTNEELVLLYWLVLPIMVVAAVRRDAETADLRLWILLLLPMIVFLPVVPPYFTMPRDPRYLTCLTIPALLVLASYLRRLPVRVSALIVTAFVATSALGIFLGKESSRMEPQQTLLQRIRGGSDRVWVTPQFAADLTFLSGVDRTLPVGIHLLQQRRTAGSFESVMLVRPDMPVAETLDGIVDGIIVMREQKTMPEVPGWTVAERLVPQPSWAVAQVQALLRLAGLEPYARKLDPGGGNVAVLYRRQSGSGPQ